uniref:Uncharacterized protein n=1 Tax=Cacopsylla melanoneura TaxID=428564 RepID=A0A8D8TJB3_9HEMI
MCCCRQLSSLKSRGHQRESLCGIRRPVIRPRYLPGGSLKPAVTNLWVGWTASGTKVPFTGDGLKQNLLLSSNLPVLSLKPVLPNMAAIVPNCHLIRQNNCLLLRNMFRV